VDAHRTRVKRAYILRSKAWHQHRHIWTLRCARSSVARAYNGCAHSHVAPSISRLPHQHISLNRISRPGTSSSGPRIAASLPPRKRLALLVAARRTNTHRLPVAPSHRRCLRTPCIIIVRLQNNARAGAYLGRGTRATYVCIRHIADMNRTAERTCARAVCGSLPLRNGRCLTLSLRAYASCGL